MKINTISGIAREIMMAGLKRKNIPLPEDFYEIAKEVFNIPERPKKYKLKRMKSETERAILVTGGLDSSVMYFKLKKKYKNLRAFYIDIGQPYYDKEIEALDNLGIKYERIDDWGIANIKKYWKHIIPARNFYFFCLVAERIRGGIIYFGAINGEMPYEGGDKSYEFLNLVSDLFYGLPYPVTIEVPLANMTKTDLVGWWKRNLLIKKLHYTNSCFDKESGHCGACQSCLRKSIAFINNGLKLKTNKPVIENTQEYIKKYKFLMNKRLKERDFSKYSERRCKQDLMGIRKLEQDYENK